MIPQEEKNAYQRNYLNPEEHGVVIREIKMHDNDTNENTMVSVKFHTWGQTYKLDIPLDEFEDMFSFFEMFAIREN